MMTEQSIKRERQASTAVVQPVEMMREHSRLVKRAHNLLRNGDLKRAMSVFAEAADAGVRLAQLLAADPSEHLACAQAYLSAGNCYSYALETDAAKHALLAARALGAGSITARLAEEALAVVDEQIARRQINAVTAGARYILTPGNTDESYENEEREHAGLSSSETRGRKPSVFYRSRDSSHSHRDLVIPITSYLPSATESGEEVRTVVSSGAEYGTSQGS